jgi:hypothetical protein
VLSSPYVEFVEMVNDGAFVGHSATHCSTDIVVHWEREEVNPSVGSLAKIQSEHEKTRTCEPEWEHHFLDGLPPFLLDHGPHCKHCRFCPGRSLMTYLWASYLSKSVYRRCMHNNHWGSKPAVCPQAIQLEGWHKVGSASENLGERLA